MWKVLREENCRMSINNDRCLGTKLSLCHRDPWKRGLLICKKILKSSKQFKFSFPPRSRSTTVQQRSNYTPSHSDRWIHRQIPAFKTQTLLAASATFTEWSYIRGGCGHLHRPLVWWKPGGCHEWTRRRAYRTFYCKEALVSPQTKNCL